MKYKDKIIVLGNKVAFAYYDNGIYSTDKIVFWTSDRIIHDVTSTQAKELLEMLNDLLEDNEYKNKKKILDCLPSSKLESDFQLDCMMNSYPQCNEKEE